MVDGRAVSLFHLPVVLEKGDIVGCCFDPHDERELVVSFDRCRTHPMSNAGPFDPRAEVVTDFVAVIPMELTTEKRCHMVRFHCDNSRAGDRLLSRSEVTLPEESDIRGIFDLHQAKVVSKAPLLDDGAVPEGETVECAMKHSDGKVIG